MAQVYKKNKLLYYIKGFLQPYLPSQPAISLIDKLKRNFTNDELEQLYERREYYNQLNDRLPKLVLSHQIKDLKKPQNPKSYYFDTYAVARHFDEILRLNWVFGDVTEVPKVPSIVKTRPISNDNANSNLSSG